MHGPRAGEDVPTTSEPAPARLAVCGVASQTQSTATESTKPSLHQAHIAGRGRHFVRCDTSRVCLVACIHVKDLFFTDAAAAAGAAAHTAHTLSLHTLCVRAAGAPPVGSQTPLCALAAHLYQM